MDKAAGAKPLQVFRQILTLRFETGGAADGIALNPEATILRATFGSMDFDALDPDEPALRASLAESGGRVFATLDAPRQVVQVALTSKVVSGSDYSLELYRLDGVKPANTPTVIAGIHSSAASAFAGDSSRKQAGKFSKHGSERVAAVPGDVDFTDARFALRLAGPTNVPLEIEDLTGLEIRSYPTGPRLAISAPEGPSPATYFWRADGVIGKTVPADEGSLDAGRPFAEALGRYLDDLFTGQAVNAASAVIPDTVEVALVVESDAPCVLDIQDFDVAYQLTRRSFPSREEKLVLRFTGSPVPLEVPVWLPDNASVRSASLAAIESFGGDRILASGNGGESSLKPLVGPSLGVDLAGDRWAGQRITPSEAGSISGIALALMTATRSTRILVELREDWCDEPTGKTLASAEITPAGVGFRQWATLMFPEAVMLTAGNYWILTSAIEGGAVWLTETGDASARVFEKPAGSPALVERSVFEGLQAENRLISRSRHALAQQPLVVRLDDSVVEGSDGPNGRRVYDLTDAIDAYLDGLPSDGSLVKVPLFLTSSLDGIITVEPVKVEYDIE